MFLVVLTVKELRSNVANAVCCSWVCYDTTYLERVTPTYLLLYNIFFLSSSGLRAVVYALVGSLNISSGFAACWAAVCLASPGLEGAIFSYLQTQICI